MIYINFKKITTSVLTAGFLFGTGAGLTSAKAYTVKSGDTLSQISADHNISLDELLSLNQQVGLNSIIYPGDHLRLSSADKVSRPVQTISTTTQTSQPVVSQSTSATTTQTSSNSGLAYQQFLAAGGTQAMWDSIVIPESGGNVNATNGQYHGLFQAQYSWGNGSVATQTKGAIQYANERYGSVANAVAYRQANGSW